MPSSPPCKRDSTLQYSCRHLWDLPLIGLERLLLHQELAQALGRPNPEESLCCNQIGFVVCDEQLHHYQLCNRKTLRELLLMELKNHDELPEELHLLVGQLYGNGRKELKSRLSLPVSYLPDSLPADALLVVRRKNLETFLLSHLHETRERITLAISRLLWLACKKNPHLDDELLAHPYKLLNVFECWAREEGLPTPALNGETLKNALQRGAPP